MYMQDANKAETDYQVEKVKITMRNLTLEFPA